MAKRMVYAEDVIALINGLESLPWEEETEHLVNSLTVADAEDVVRCKDCKHLVLTEDGLHNPNDCVCDYWMADGLNDFDFCSYGERK